MIVINPQNKNNLKKNKWYENRFCGSIIFGLLYVIMWKLLNFDLAVLVALGQILANITFDK